VFFRRVSCQLVVTNTWLTGDPHLSNVCLQATSCCRTCFGDIKARMNVRGGTCAEQVFSAATRWSTSRVFGTCATEQACASVPPNGYERVRHQTGMRGSERGTRTEVPQTSNSGHKFGSTNFEHRARDRCLQQSERKRQAQKHRHSDCHTCVSA
jgi:hypothetical protein